MITGLWVISAIAILGAFVFYKSKNRSIEEYRESEAIKLQTFQEVKENTLYNAKVFVYNNSDNLTYSSHLLLIDKMRELAQSYYSFAEKSGDLGVEPQSVHKVNNSLRLAVKITEDSMRYVGNSSLRESDRRADIERSLSMVKNISATLTASLNKDFEKIKGRTDRLNEAGLEVNTAILEGRDVLETIVQDRTDVQGRTEGLT